MDAASTKTPGCDVAPQRIGLLAGWGRFPVIIAETLIRSGHEVYCLGVHGHADPVLREVCTSFQGGGMAKFGRAARYLQRNDVHHAMMAGKIHKHLLFQPRFILRQLPDWPTIRLFAPQFLFRTKDCKDDTLLLSVVQFFADRGITLGPPTDYAPELLVKEGQLTRRGPSAAQWKDIRFGWEMAKEMGRLDVGQSVVVKSQATLAIEAIEGTDLCIERAGKLCTAGGFTVVKVAKPQQDMRFDVPTIGLRTVKKIRESGGRVLAVEADRTIILDQNEVVEYANRNGLIIVAVRDEALTKD